MFIIERKRESVLFKLIFTSMLKQIISLYLIFHGFYLFLYVDTFVAIMVFTPFLILVATLLAYSLKFNFFSELICLKLYKDKISLKYYNYFYFRKKILDISEIEIYMDSPFSFSIFGNQCVLLIKYNGKAILMQSVSEKWKEKDFITIIEEFKERKRNTVLLQSDT